MTTINKNQELAIFVCQNCGCHSVGDPVWLDITGQTLDIKCDNCFGDYNPHLIVKFVQAETPKGDKI